MATVVKQFSFNTDLEGWSPTDGAQTISTRDTTEDSPNDTNAGTGTIQTRISGKNRSNANLWEWTGTWEDLGVPAGSTVTAVQMSSDWRCYEYTTGASSTIGPGELRDGSGTLRFTFGTGSAFSATSSFATRVGATSSGMTDASNTTIKLRLNNTLNTGNSNTAAVGIRQDWIQVTVTYTAPPPAIDTAYRVSFPTPAATLQTGAGLQEFDAQVYVDGAGSPTGALYLYESGTQVGSALWTGTVTGTSASPTKITGTWDATGRIAANIEARFVGTGVSGGTARLHSIEWNAAETAVGGFTRSATDAAGAADSTAKAQRKAVADTAGAVDSRAVAQRKALSDAAGAADSIALVQRKVQADPAAASDSTAKAVRKAVADLAGGADSSSKAERKAAFDSAGAADVESHTTGGAIQRAVTDAAGAADATAYLKRHPESVTDGAGAADAIAKAQRKSVADAAGAADAETHTTSGAVQRSATDVAGASDSTAAKQSKALADPAGAADSLAKALRVSVADAAGASDTPATARAIRTSATNGAGAADSTAKAERKALADSAGAADSTSKAQRKAATDTAGVVDTEAHSTSGATARSVVDGAGASDGIATQLYQLEALVPDGIVFDLTNLSGAYSDIDEDPNSPDAAWLVVT